MTRRNVEEGERETLVRQFTQARQLRITYADDCGTLLAKQINRRVNRDVVPGPLPSSEPVPALDHDRAWVINADVRHGFQPPATTTRF